MILAFTGAGISKASGIPTFAEQGDMRLKLSRSYSIRHPEDYKNTVNMMVEACEKAEPNDAHIALAEYNIPIITMNVDKLHHKAGSKNILAIHGELPDSIVLYEDPAPLYSDAFAWVDRLGMNDILLIVGVSFYTNISSQLKQMARNNGAKVVILNEKAEENVRAYIENHKEYIGDFEEFMKRTTYY